jgi:hypothetical protein
LLLLLGCSTQDEVQEPESLADTNPIVPNISYVSNVSSVDRVYEVAVDKEPSSPVYVQFENVVPDPEMYEDPEMYKENVVFKDQAQSHLPEDWMNWPVVPLATDTAIEIYNRGLALGNNPHAFSKFGDCQNIPSMFMSTFDDPSSYSLGEDYDYLEGAIEWFSGSFARESESVRSGFNAASVVSPIQADPEACKVVETPLDCEIRLQRPSFAIISLETWWGEDPAGYEKYLREIIEMTIGYGTVPIIATKADDFEGGHRINATLARLAYEFDIPLWNFWRAVQPLPDHGLSDDGFHLTYASNQFDNLKSMTAAWPWRNLTALQALDAVWRGVTDS